MSVEEQLRALTAPDEAPTMADLGGEAELLASVSGLPEELISRAADAVWQAWPDIADRSAALAVLASRLPEVTAGWNMPTSRTGL